MPHYRVTGYIRIEDGEYPTWDDIYYSDDLDLIVEAECRDDAVFEAAYLAIEKGLLDLPYGWMLFEMAVAHAVA